MKRNTLVIATSFSGNTEEALSFAKESLARNAKIICICSGGKLEDFAKKNKLPYYSFTSDHNPSRIPRYGSGYLFMAQMAMLHKVGVIKISQREIQDIINAIQYATAAYELAISQKDNLAKQLATQLQGKAICLVSSQHLVGSTYIFKNQLNESSKQFSTMFEIPELNHHLLEGLGHPKSNKKI